MKSCLNCDTKLNEFSQSYITLCKPCYIEIKCKDRYNKCTKCNNYNLNKNKDYTICYTCHKKETWKQYLFSN